MINNNEIAVDAKVLIRKSPNDPKLSHSKNTNQV
jgi:hypothetical protein